MNGDGFFYCPFDIVLWGTALRLFIFMNFTFWYIELLHISFRSSTLVLLGCKSAHKKVQSTSSFGLRNLAGVLEKEPVLNSGFVDYSENWGHTQTLHRNARVTIESGSQTKKKV